jgi:L-threo-3-deoxy-hexylosonate aldolase
MPRELKPGIYTPTQAFFLTGTEDLDLGSIGSHAVRQIKAGIVGITTNGSNGEAVYLSREERAVVTSTTRKALDAAGFGNVPIIVGATEQSVRGTIDLCRDAATGGGDAVLLMAPSFFKWAMDSAAIERYFTQVADRSPLPVLIYNYPGAVGGIDLDSELLERLATHSNIVGIKFTCGNVGKLARVAAATCSISEFGTMSPPTSSFFAFAGIADFILPSVVVGGSGAIVGAANVFPRMCVHVYRLSIQGQHEEARKAQQALARVDWSLTKRAIPGFKAILQKYHGYGGVPRQPMAALSTEAAEELFREIKELMEIEKGLPDLL